MPASFKTKFQKIKFEDSVIRLSYLCCLLDTKLDKSLIIVTKADKGGAVIIADVDDYVQEANQQLGNKEFHKKITIGSTEINQMKVTRTISEVKSSLLLNEKIAKSKNTTI